MGLKLIDHPTTWWEEENVLKCATCLLCDGLEGRRVMLSRDRVSVNRWREGGKGVEGRGKRVDGWRRREVEE